MPKCCAAYNCSNNSKDKSLSFHQFPIDPVSRGKWIAATKRKNFNPTHHSCLCSKHFDEDHFEVGGLRRKLKPNVIPTRFDFPPHLQESKPKTRRTLFRTQTASTSDELDSALDENSRQKNTRQEINVNCGAERENKSEEEHKIIPKRKITFSPTKVKLRRKVKILQQRLKRRDDKLEKLSDIIRLLKKKVDAPETVIEKLQENFSGLPLELLISNFKNNKVARCKRSYTEKMKEFALTLYFYSPKAYNFLRKMSVCLPYPSTIRRWLSKFNCSPGVLSEVFAYLKHNIATNDDLKHVSLVFDSMSIRKQLIYDHHEHKHFGYVDFGGFKIESHEELATEALVFQIVSLKANFKCIVAYFFVNKTNAYILSQLIKTIILKLQEIKIKVHNVTCDGPSTNLAALSNLGCKLPEKPWFRLPTMNHDVFVTLDTCHMVKLCRNTLAEKRSIESEDGLVEFKYIEALNNLQKSEGLNFANKLSDKHIRFTNKKMNVRLAVQTLSAGVAGALEFLLTNGHPNFVGCKPLIRFVRIIDRLFDFLNTRNPFGKNFKEPIKPSNKKWNDTFLKEAYDYLKSLKVEDVPLLLHARKTFLLGFLTNINTIRKLEDRLLNDESFKYILTYKMSQDHLELFFSCIRSMGGNNDNPNVRQFQYALRKLMFRNSVQASDSANCLEFDPYVQESTLSLIEAKNISLAENSEEDVDDEEDLNTIRYLTSTTRFTSYYQENILYYISGFITKKITTKTKCQECKNVLVKQQETKPQSYMDFMTSINMGGLFYPHEDVLKLMKFFHSHLDKGVTKSGMVDRLVNMACSTYATSIFRNHKEIVQLGETPHEIKLIKMIGYFYFKIMLHHQSKLRTIQQNPSSIGLRQKLHKLILFKNT